MHNPIFRASPLAVIHTLPPTEPPAKRVRRLLRGDALAFWPARMGGRAGLVARAEAARFFRGDPDRPHATLVARNICLVSAPDGSALAALEEALAVPHERGPDPAGPGPARSLRD